MPRPTIVFSNTPKVQGSDDDNSDDEFDAIDGEEQYIRAGQRHVESGEFRKLEVRIHALKRPDLYIGSVDRVRQTVWSFTDRANAPISQQTVSFSNGLYQIIYEPLSNSADNVTRSESKGCKQTYIELEVWKDRVRIRNDGFPVPTGESAEKGILIPELAFGHAMAGNNFDDSGQRMISGRNGLGVSLTNIFSRRMRVKIGGHDQMYEQEWTKNMSICGKPTVTARSDKGETFTEVEFWPDFRCFPGSENGIDATIANLVQKAAIDASMITGVEVRIISHIDGCPSNTHCIRNLPEYAQLYGVRDHLYLESSDCRVVLYSSSNPNLISFVNGIYTARNGVHVDAWKKVLFGNLVERLNPLVNGRTKDARKLTRTDMNRHFGVFVISTLVNPRFTTQTKEQLSAPVPVPVFRKTALACVKDWGVIDRLKAEIAQKELSKMAKQSRKKKGWGSGLIHANQMGKEPNKCVLVICEGLSARTAVLARVSLGIQIGGKSYIGNDYVGTLATTGKIINVHEATVAKTTASKFVQAFLDAIGADPTLDYSNNANYNKLKYHHLAMARDADADGMHIEGLVIAFLHRYLPTLMEREDFLGSIMTPVGIIQTKDNRTKVFYDESNFEDYKSDHRDTVKTAEYMKGLGGMDDEQISLYMGHHSRVYHMSNDIDHIVANTFAKSRSDYRKEWIAAASANLHLGRTQEPNGVNPLVLDESYSHFLDVVMVRYSIASCYRAIPDGVDGLKESQRMVLHTCIARKMWTEGKKMKLSQLSGAVSESCDYHHGEEGLPSTIAGLAHSWVGSNNVPLLVEKAQMGSRLENGKDCAQARYAHTYLRPYIRQLFPMADLDVLDYTFTDSGKQAQPVRFAPILPLLLLNGCKGIGTGWSTNVPCFNVSDVALAVKEWIKSGGTVYRQNGRIKIRIVHEIKPDYLGFTGDIVRESSKRWISHGTAARVSRNKVRYTELPIGTSTLGFIQMLSEYKSDKRISGIRNNSTKYRVDITVTETEEVDMTKIPFTSNINLTNLSYFGSDGKIRKESDPLLILDEHCRYRQMIYQRRKKATIDSITLEIMEATNKRRLIDEEGQGKIKLRVPKDDLRRQLTEGKYDLMGGTYNYLLRMPISNLTTDEYNKLTEFIDKKTNIELVQAVNMDMDQVWMDEIDKFLVSYTKFEKEIAKRNKA